MILVDEDCSLFKPSKLNVLMECVLQVVLILAPPSLRQTETYVEELQILVHTNSVPGVHNLYTKTHSSNV